MVFRILIIGGRQRFEDARLRDTIDQLLANRLPDTDPDRWWAKRQHSLRDSQPKTKLTLTTITLDYTRHGGDADDWRNGRRVEQAAIRL